MEHKRLKLPVGIQTFEEIRTQGYLYVDKTQYLVNMIDSGKAYFLARPRRFGKSLTVSAFDALFSGKKELFKGLYAEEFFDRPDFQPSPVIRLDMSNITTDEGIEGVKESLLTLTRNVARKLDVELSGTQLAGDLLGELISKTAEQHNRKPVILLDEYDKPYTDFVNDHDMAEKVRDVLRNFYVRIKANDEHIRFIFITGISKFAKFGVFSTLNTLLDISLMPRFAAICGYTEEELVGYFSGYLDKTAQYMEISTKALIDKMRFYYNGFSFDSGAKARLFNPFSTLTFFENMDFLNYWIDTGKPKFIADYMKNRNLTVEQFRNFPITKDFAKSPGDVDTASPAGFLYQAGYLTLRQGVHFDLVLDYPNTEVLNSMSDLLTINILAENANPVQQTLLMALAIGDVEKTVEMMNCLLARIPYDDFTGAAKQSVYIGSYQFPAQEWLYRSTLFAFLQGCGVVVEAEMHTHKGRPDLVVSYRGKVWVIEIKVACQGDNAAEKASEAYRQIMEKEYAKPFPSAICLGLGIDDTLRQIAASKSSDQ